jgi:hypothetical protein
MCMPLLLRLVLRPCESGLTRQISFHTCSFVDEVSCSRFSKYGLLSVGHLSPQGTFDKLAPVSL